MNEQIAAVLAHIEANTDGLKSVQAGIDALKQSNAGLSDEIAALRTQIADANAAIDLAPLEAKLAEQSALIVGLKTAIPAGTPFDPSANWQA